MSWILGVSSFASLSVSVQTSISALFHIGERMGLEYCIVIMLQILSIEALVFIII